MAKHRTLKDDRQAQGREAVTVQLPLPVLGVYLDARGAFHELCIETGRQALHAMMEADREVLCGPKGKHDPDRQASRAGSAPSWVTLGGRQIDVKRLRVRSGAGEERLPSFAWAADRDPLDAHTLEAVAAGVSTRKYERTLDPVPAGVRGRGAKRSSVSRRFVALSAQQMHAFLLFPSNRTAAPKAPVTTSPRRSRPRPVDARVAMTSLTLVGSDKRGGSTDPLWQGKGHHRIAAAESPLTVPTRRDDHILPLASLISHRCGHARVGQLSGP